MDGEITTAGQVLCRYVDGLELSVDGEPRPQVFEELRAKKSAQQTSPWGRKRFGSISGVPGGDFILTTDGDTPFQFILYSSAISRLEVTKRRELPKVLIQFRAKTLFEHDLEQLNDIVEALAGFFLEPGFEVTVSTFHLALDWQSEAWAWPAVEDVV